MQSINIELKASVDFRGYEAYNTLRTNIQFCGKEVKIICITSCIPGEGKSTVSIRLAASMAEGGKKVLFIDADLRKSNMIKRLKINQSVNGLSQYLSGMNTCEEVIYNTNLEGLDMIFTGPIPPNPSDLLSNRYFKELLQCKREEYDYIIIDTPPLGLVIDSANVAESCDGALIVIQADANSYKFVQKIMKQLEKSNCRVLGAVLNKVEVKHQRYYGLTYKKYYGAAYAPY
ncbi:CpsD/CapB family tyrosine-protein kinase [Anaerocolumna sp. AGMB13020]|uniref:CpsD/CapB family tyrosine-protein kinase n=1 Tax=Anaerocolumna sp. AGMB13020 TaxID=3081750 RepID=UPI00295427F8|nr:CpsD/CapB family tyrosine-protein kinase [Anaerocolumna sp. AGMB13020]WOO38841.1 CpsD/CapB family tyrosine-protein kinase [Anaerocolumna sp. AGMB13020]